MNHSFVSPNNRFRRSDAKQSLKKVDVTRVKFLSCLGDNCDIPVFEDLLEFFDEKLDVVVTRIKNLVINGIVVRVESSDLIIETGLKNRAKVSKHELQNGMEPLNFYVGDTIKVIAQSIDSINSPYIRASWAKAQRVTLWKEFKQAMKDQSVMKGAILEETRGGFIVNIQGVRCFCPASHVDFRTCDKATIDQFRATEQQFIVLSMDEEKFDSDRGAEANIIVSRREVLNKKRMELKEVAMGILKVGDVLKGTVKNIAPYGCFINIAVKGEIDVPQVDGSIKKEETVIYVDGLLHVNDMSWKKIDHPAEMLKTEDQIDVMIIGLIDNKKISLGIKQLSESPWRGIGERFKVGDIVNGVVKSLAEYGCFVEIENCVEGLVHISEMSWFKRPLGLSIGQEIQAMILSVDEEKCRISLSIKQCTESPWVKFAAKHKTGTVIDAIVKKRVDFGIFVDLGDDTEGMIHISDISWDNDGQERMNSQEFEIGKKIPVKLLSVDIEKSRILLGVKQVKEDPFKIFLDKVSVGDIIKNCQVVGSWNTKVELLIEEARTIVSVDLETLPKLEKGVMYSKGVTVDCRVGELDKDKRRITLVGLDYVAPVKKEDGDNIAAVDEKTNV